jgi:hypothetical protein
MGVQRQAVLPAQHPQTARTVGCMQDGVLTLLVQKEDSDMIKPKLLADQFCDGREECIQILHGRDRPRDA